MSEVRSILSLQREDCFFDTKGGYAKSDLGLHHNRILARVVQLRYGRTISSYLRQKYSFFFGSCGKGR